MSVEATEQAQGGVKPSWAALKAQHRRTRRSTRVTLRGDLLDEVDRLEAQMRREAEADEWQNRHPKAPQIAKEIQALEEEARASEVEFVFEGLGRGDYAKLMAKHKPSKGDEDVYGTDMPWASTFPAALMAASCVEPAELKGDVAEWTEINDTWSVGQVSRIWATCLDANALVADTPKSALASATLLRDSSANNSTTASR